MEIHRHPALNCLAFDATNFFTFINTRNTKTDLAQRGHNKNGRCDLRQISLVLLVSTDFHVSLFHETYAGNRPDAVEFRSALSRLQQRQEEFTRQCRNITLVFDKGKNSAEGFELLGGTEFHFVGSLSPMQHPDLLAIPLPVQLTERDELQNQLYDALDLKQFAPV